VIKAYIPLLAEEEDYLFKTPVAFIHAQIKRGFVNIRLEPPHVPYIEIEINIKNLEKRYSVERENEEIPLIK